MAKVKHPPWRTVQTIWGRTMWGDEIDELIAWGKGSDATVRFSGQQVILPKDYLQPVIKLWVAKPDHRGEVQK